MGRLVLTDECIPVFHFSECGGGGNRALFLLVAGPASDPMVTSDSKARIRGPGKKSGRYG